MEMTYDDKLDLIQREAEIQAIICEREAMIALNQDRLAQGHTIGYDELSFSALADKLREIQNVQWKYRKETP